MNEPRASNDAIAEARVAREATNREAVLHERRRAALFIVACTFGLSFMMILGSVQSISRLGYCDPTGLFWALRLVSYVAGCVIT